MGLACPIRVPHYSVNTKHRAMQNYCDILTFDKIHPHCSFYFFRRNKIYGRNIMFVDIIIQVRILNLYLVLRRMPTEGGVEIPRLVLESRICTQKNPEKIIILVFGCPYSRWNKDLFHLIPSNTF